MGPLYSRSELIQARREWRESGKTVVFTNGCYDLLHPGHVRLLEQARLLGDILVLGLNTDASVARMKGPGRPIVNELDRAALTGSPPAITCNSPPTRNYDCRVSSPFNSCEIDANGRFYT
jgi:cytidyltransferase-like protein